MRQVTWEDEWFPFRLQSLTNIDSRGGKHATTAVCMLDYSLGAVQQQESNGV
jgi:hypothetical protein